MKQKNLTVDQYEILFTKLSKYAPDMVNTEEKRIRRFLQGLNIEIQTLLVSAKMDTYAKLVEFAQRAEDYHVKLRELQNQNSKELGPQNWINTVGSSTQGSVRRSQKRLGQSFRKQSQNQREEMDTKGKRGD